MRSRNPDTGKVVSIDPDWSLSDGILRQLLAVEVVISQPKKEVMEKGRRWFENNKNVRTMMKMKKTRKTKKTPNFVVYDSLTNDIAPRRSDVNAAKFKTHTHASAPQARKDLRDTGCVLAPRT